MQRLNFSEEPEYNKYENLITELLSRSGGKIGEKYCWEPKIEETFEKIKNKKASFEEIKKFHELFKGFPI